METGNLTKSFLWNKKDDSEFKCINLKKLFIYQTIILGWLVSWLDSPKDNNQDGRIVRCAI